MRSVRARLIPSEADVQAAIVDALRWRGETVLVTSRHRRRCLCGRYPPAGDGCDRGIPDLLVHIGGLWLGLEVKGTRTRLSPEQRALEQAGAIRIVRTVEDAIGAVAEARQKQTGGA